MREKERKKESAVKQRKGRRKKESASTGRERLTLWRTRVEVALAGDHHVVHKVLNHSVVVLFGDEACRAALEGPMGAQRWHGRGLLRPGLAIDTGKQATYAAHQPERCTSGC